MNGWMRWQMKRWMRFLKSNKMKKISVFKWLSLAGLGVFVLPALASLSVEKGVLAPGGFVVLKTEPESEWQFQHRTVKADKTGRLLVGFGRDAKLTQTFKRFNRHKLLEKHTFKLMPRHYTVQRINGLPKNKVTPDKVTLARIWRDIKLAKQTRRIKLPTPYFESGFIWPTSGIISGVYGSQRILNGHPRRPHLGVDIAAPKGQLIVAPADGKVTLAKKMELSGNTLMIDHGWGLRSTLMHMHKMYVKKGELVKKGQPIGEVGQTGRATGPHLHWGMSWFSTRLDPSLSLLAKPSLKPGDRVKSGVTTQLAP